MKLDDYSPDQMPSTLAQQDALQKGLGRAAMWASSGRLSTELLLEACLHDKRHDKQCEDSRGDWLWRLMDLRGVVEVFREPVFDALAECAFEYDAFQLCEIVSQYAEQGDQRALDLLWEVVERRPIPDTAWVGVGQLLRLSGIDAFKRIVQIRGATLETSDWDWYDDALVDSAVELLGENSIHALLAEPCDSDCKTFSKAWQQRQEMQPSRTTRRSCDSFSIEEVTNAVYSSDPCRWLRSWGRTASDNDLLTVLSMLRRTRDPKHKVKLLQAFAVRPLPAFDPYMVALCSDESYEVRQHAFRALANNKHVAIHNFAIEQIYKGDSDLVMQLFVNNFREGDEKQILDAIQLADTPNDRHWLLMNIIKVLDANPESDSSQLALVAYFYTPCEICRRGAIELLLGDDAAPSWLVEEVREDSSEESRQLVYPV